MATDSRAAGTAVDWPCWCPVAVEDVSRGHSTLLSRARLASPHCTAIWNIPARFAQGLFVASEDHCSLEEPERKHQGIPHNQEMYRKLYDTQAAPLGYWNGSGCLTVQIVGGGFQPRACCSCRASAKPHYILEVLLCACGAHGLCHCGLLCLLTLHWSIYLAAGNVLGSSSSGGGNAKLHHIVPLTGREKPKGGRLHWHRRSDCHLFKCPEYALRIS